MIYSLLLTAVLAAGPLEFAAQTLDGEQAQGKLTSLSDKELVLDTSRGVKKFPFDKLADVAQAPPAVVSTKATTLWVELIDGSGIAAAEYTVRSGKASIRTAAGTALEIPTKAIRWVRFGAPDSQDPKLTKQWTEITESKATGDTLVVRKNESLDYLEGVLGDVNAETCQFELEKEDVPVKRAKIAGLIYARISSAEMPESIGRLILTDGSRLEMKNVDLAQDRLAVFTPAGTALEVPLQQAARFDFSSGKVAYLSDLEPESAIFTPLLGSKDDPAGLREFFQYRRDVGFDQSPLRLDGKVYRKGLALQSRTALVYKLPGKFRLFRGTIGVDDSVRDTGNLRVEIKGDGRTLWSANVRGVDPAQELELDIAKVKRLEIVADYGDDQDIGDRLDVGEARVTK